MSEHPVDRLAHRLGGRDRVVLAWLGLSVAGFVIPPEGSQWVLVGLLVLLGGGFAFTHRGQEQSRRENRVDDLVTQYADGEITLDQYERQVELVLDPRAQRIREAVEQADDVGEATSAKVALQFYDVDALRDATVGDLEAIEGVGPQRAAAIVAEVGSG